MLVYKLMLGYSLYRLCSNASTASPCLIQPTLWVKMRPKSEGFKPLSVEILVQGILTCLSSDDGFGAGCIPPKYLARFNFCSMS